MKQHEAGYAGRVKRHLWQNLIVASKKMYIFIVLNATFKIKQIENQLEKAK